MVELKNVAAAAKYVFQSVEVMLFYDQHQKTRGEHPSHTSPLNAADDLIAAS